MKNECCLIKDLLPLYKEGMVSEETSLRIKEHLENCKDCKEEYESLKEDLILEEIDDKEEIQILKKTKKKIIITRLLYVFGAVVITVASLFTYSYLKPMSVHYGESELYSKEEMNYAIEEMMNIFNQWEGCKMYEICYTSDKICIDELEYINSLTKDKYNKEYSECIVFTISFRTPFFGGGAWPANRIYHWDFYIGKATDGTWEAVTWGVG